MREYHYLDSYGNAIKCDNSIYWDDENDDNNYISNQGLLFMAQCHNWFSNRIFHTVTVNSGL